MLGSLAFLDPIVRERARILAPAVLLAVLRPMVFAGSLGIDQGIIGAALNWSIIGLLACLTAALLVRRVPLRWIHHAAAAVLWSPILAAAIALFTSRNQIVGVFFILPIACAGVLLHRGWSVATVIGATAIAIPLVFRAEGENAGLLSMVIVGSGVFAVLIHVLMRGSLVTAETHRLEAVSTSEKLAQRLADLERVQHESARLHAQLLHAQRMEAVGTLAAGIAHDMNNVLGSITSFSSLALDRLADEPARQDVEQVIVQAKRGAALTRGLLAFSHRGQYRKQVVRLGEVVAEVLPLLARTLPRSIEIRAALELGDACVDADPVHLQQALVNLGLNAADAMAGSGTLEISAHIIELDGVTVPSLPGGRFARLRVTDTGVGMDAATRGRVFEPFFTSKPLGQGTGLGLSMVWGIVQGHGGAVEVESALGEGSTFQLYLPLTERPPVALVTSRPTAPAAPRPATASGARTRTILVVEDEAAVRESTRRVLERMGHTVLTAADGAEGVATMRRHGDQIELVVLDMGMPVMGGAECFQKIREQSLVPILIATGYAIDEEVQVLVAAGATILEKPFPAADLQREVTTLLRG